jgi:hypothetical protein
LQWTRKEAELKAWNKEYSRQYGNADTASSWNHLGIPPPLLTTFSSHSVRNSKDCLVVSFVPWDHTVQWSSQWAFLNFLKLQEIQTLKRTMGTAILNEVLTSIPNSWFGGYAAFLTIRLQWQIWGRVMIDNKCHFDHIISKVFIIITITSLLALVTGWDSTCQVCTL